MNYIILDLEWNWRRYKVNPEMPNEIIEIGAVKLNDSCEIIDTFRIFVKPFFYNSISKQVNDKTGITNQDLKYGLAFKKAVELFKKWLGKKYLIYTWGSDDLLELKNNYLFHKIKFNLDEKSFINLQEEVISLLNIDNQPSLENTLKCFGIEQSDNLHQALNDAIYTSKILYAIRKTNYLPLPLYSLMKSKKDYGKRYNQPSNKRKRHFKPKPELELNCQKCGGILEKENGNWQSESCFRQMCYCNNCNIRFRWKFFVKENKLECMILEQK